MSAITPSRVIFRARACNSAKYHSHHSKVGPVGSTLYILAANSRAARHESAPNTRPAIRDGFIRPFGAEIGEISLVEGNLMTPFPASDDPPPSTDTFFSGFSREIDAWTPP